MIDSATPPQHPRWPWQRNLRWPRFLLSVVVILVVFGIAFASLWWWRIHNTNLAFSPTPIISASPTASPTPQSNKVNTYTSQKIRVSFNYLESEGSPIIEEGNKIYVGGKTGQSVEVFTKDPQDSLTVAIQKKLLPGNLKDKCPVSAEGVSFVGEITPANFEKAYINFDFTPTGLDDPRMDSSPCPIQYRATNGLRYFLIDKNHPDRFFFFDIGQYAIMAEPGTDGTQKTWQDTFVVNQ